METKETALEQENLNANSSEGQAYKPPFDILYEDNHILVVLKGQMIACVAEANGNEYKDGAHLHFELRKDGKIVDPATYLTLEEK